jgi:ectoine hydroxylase-related dioxygenase (phytanoyl-CoA dioxygenase family)
VKEHAIVNTAATRADLDIRTKVRDVTREEIDFYADHGWVFLPELVSRDFAAELLSAAKEHMPPPREGSGNRNFGPLAVDGYEPFRTFAFSREVATVAHDLIDRQRITHAQVPIQFHSDLIWCKGPGANGTEFHQDNSIRPADRPGVFNMWMALDEVTPGMGGMRFLDGVHREGPLGLEHFPPPPDLAGDDLREFTNRGMLNYYSRLTDLYEWTPEFHYLPGDATVHHGDMVHGGGPNISDRPRWAYIVEYMPADTKFFFDGDERVMAGRNTRYLPGATNPLVRNPHRAD